MKRALSLLLLLLLVTVTTVLTRHNADTVPFDYYFGNVDLPLIVLLFAAFVAGALLALFLTLAIAFVSRRESARLRRRLHLCEQEIKNLRDIPIKGQH